LLEDSLYAIDDLALGAGSSVSHNLAAFDGVDGNQLEDSGIATDDVAIGAGSSVADNIVTFDGTDGKTMKDSGVAVDDVAIGAASSTADNLVSFVGTDGKELADSGIAKSTVAIGAASTTANSLVRFNGTDGKVLKQSDTTLSDSEVMTFPAGGGNVLTAGAGAAERKGTVTLVGGASGDIATTAAVTGCVISLSIVALGTVTDPMPMLITITNGASFTITSEDATDTSVINWAIVA
jgi:hypothetical protein